MVPLKLSHPELFMNFRHLVWPVARAVGAAIGFRARLRPARRGSDPERDEKFESGSWRAPAAVRAGLAGGDGPPKRIFSAPRLPSKTSKRERRHSTRRSPKSSNKELGENVLPHWREFAQEPVRYAAAALHQQSSARQAFGAESIGGPIMYILGVNIPASVRVYESA